MSSWSIYLLCVVALLGLCFPMSYIGHLRISYLHFPFTGSTLQETSGTNWEKNLISLKVLGILPLTSLKPGFHLIYLFKKEVRLLSAIHPFLPLHHHCGHPQTLRSVWDGADAAYLLLFQARLSMLSERCTSRPHCKWPFNELVKDLNYPRTWEKAF